MIKISIKNNKANYILRTAIVTQRIEEGNKKRLTFAQNIV